MHKINPTLYIFCAANPELFTTDAEREAAQEVVEGFTHNLPVHTSFYDIVQEVVKKDKETFGQ